jgi:hypothetical protein
MKKILAFIFIVSCVVFAANSAKALTMASVDGDWSNPVRANNVPNDSAMEIAYNNGVVVAYGNTKQDQIRWGHPIPLGGNQKSGLGFTGVVNGVTVNVEQAFEIGQLVHFNNSVQVGTSAKAVDLEITLQFGANYYPFTFTLGVLETTNTLISAGPPPVFTPGSDDWIYFPSSISSESVEIGGIYYTLQILGFGPSAGSLVEDFRSTEGATNSTLLWGILIPIPVPAVDIEKYVSVDGGDNWDDADEEPGPTAIVGDLILWEYEVTNTGDVDLTGVVVVDDAGTPGDTIDDFEPQYVGGDDGDGIMQVGEIWYYEASDSAVAGQYTNIAYVETEQEVADDDPASYFGEKEPGDEGCTPGFWKNNADKKGASAWVGYEPCQRFKVVFGLSGFTIKGNGKFTISNPTLLQALGANGSGINLLARSAVAALLNASNPNVNYPLTEVEIINKVKGAIAAGNNAIQALGEELDEYNNLGCPINQCGKPIMY